jgi:CRP-like cAMP-binding protein
MKQPIGVHPTAKKHISCALCATRGKSIFCSASKDQAQLLDRYKTTQEYKKGQVLFYEGAPAMGVYCVFSGSMKLFKSTSAGRQEIIGIAVPGDVLGYESLFTDKPFSHSVEALEESKVCFIAKVGFQSVISQNPSIMAALVKDLSQELEAIEDRLLDQVDKPAHVRMARLLLVLRQTHGKPGARGVDLNIELSRQDIAAMIGTTQETAIRLLSRFKARGFIQLNKRAITILNPDALLKASRLSSL